MRAAGTTLAGLALGGAIGLAALAIPARAAQACGGFAEYGGSCNDAETDAANIGLEDPVYAFPISQMTKAAIPNAQLAVILGASHASIFERPELASRAILDWAGVRR